jgi:hypothetical protein
MKMKNLNKEISANVMVHRGSCSMGGMFITEHFTTGTIIKINAKSIRLHLTHAKTTRNRELITNRDMDKEATFQYWKTVDGRELYKNNEYGILEF